MIIEIAVSLAVGCTFGFYVGQRGMSAFKAELDVVITKAETIGKTEIADVLKKLKAKL